MCSAGLRASCREGVCIRYIKYKSGGTCVNAREVRVGICVVRLVMGRHVSCMLSLVEAAAPRDARAAPYSPTTTTTRRRRHTHRHTPQLSETAGLDHVVMARCIRRRPPACLRVVGCSVIGRPPSPYRRCNGAASFAVCCARRAVRGALRSVRFCACGLARCSRGRAHRRAAPR